MNYSQSVNSLLEDYVLQVAAEYIDLISPNDQTKLINLVNKIGEPLLDARPLPHQPLKRVDKVVVNIPFRGLEQQWLAALASPLSRKLGLTGSASGFLQRLLVVNQREIEAAQVYIQRMDSLIERAETTGRRFDYQNRLIEHYQAIRSKYISHLDQLKSFQERSCSCS